MYTEHLEKPEQPLSITGFVSFTPAYLLTRMHDGALLTIMAKLNRSPTGPEQVILSKIDGVTYERGSTMLKAEFMRGEGLDVHETRDSLLAAVIAADTKGEELRKQANTEASNLNTLLGSHPSA